MTSSSRDQINAAHYFAEIAGETFDGADLMSIAPQQVRFVRCSFRDVDLRQSVLDGCSFARCDLRGAVLRGASLRNVRFIGCDLRDADLRDCDLTGSNFSFQATGDDTGLTDITGAKLTGAQLATTTVEQVIGWPGA